VHVARAGCAGHQSLQKDQNLLLLLVGCLAWQDCWLTMHHLHHLQQQHVALL
jgi:hypothetical protein